MRFLVLPLFPLALMSCKSESATEMVISKDEPGNPVAVDCEGTVRQVDIQPDGTFYVSERAERTWFIFDTVRKTLIAVDPEQAGSSGNYSNFCDTEPSCRVEVSASQLTASYDGDLGRRPRRRAMVLNRMDGSMTEHSRFGGEGSGETVYNESYKCVRIPVPIPYREKFGPPLL